VRDVVDVNNPVAAEYLFPLLLYCLVVEKAHQASCDPVHSDEKLTEYVPFTPDAAVWLVTTNGDPDASTGGKVRMSLATGKIARLEVMLIDMIVRISYNRDLTY
jgi:hypothetical protein